MEIRMPGSSRMYAGTGLLIAVLAVVLILCGLAFAGFYGQRAAYGLNAFVRHGWSPWISVSPDDQHLSPAMRLALRAPSAEAEAGAFAWRTIAEGFDVGELPVIVAGAEVDRILLARIDPVRFRFVVRNAPAGNRNLGDWMQGLGAALVVNGSYYAHDGTPDTPIVSAGIRSGPEVYEARHGAFVASAAFVGIHDLSHEDWKAALQDADEAMVSYPLLLAEDGSNRVNANPRWLANRSFVAVDRGGLIVIGTTTDAFFSLERLATFLRTAPLGLKLALNLDGGPVASQGIALNGFHRQSCGRFELSASGESLHLLHGEGCWQMPVVLAVLSK
jgi:hypothetical protein